MTAGPNPSERLEYLRGELRAERISYGELIELQGLAEHIDPGDVELREAAGIPEHDEEPESYYDRPDDLTDTVFDPHDETFGPIMADIQSGNFEEAAERLAALAKNAPG